MSNIDQATLEIVRANLKRLEAARAARPHCTVNRGLLAMALKSLAAIFEDVTSGNSVVVAFDGHVLSPVPHFLQALKGRHNHRLPGSQISNLQSGQSLAVPPLHLRVFALETPCHHEHAAGPIPPR